MDERVLGPLRGVEPDQGGVLEPLGGRQGLEVLDREGGEPGLGVGLDGRHALGGELGGPPVAHGLGVGLERALGEGLELRVGRRVGVDGRLSQGGQGLLERRHGRWHHRLGAPRDALAHRSRRWLDRVGLVGLAAPGAHQARPFETPARRAHTCFPKAGPRGPVSLVPVWSARRP